MSATGTTSVMRRIRRKLGAIELSRLLRVSAALTLIALALMVWSMVQPTPLPVMLAMTVGQALGTLAFAIYGYVVIADLRRIRRARRAGDAGDAGDASHASGASGAGDASGASGASGAPEARP